MSPTLQTSMIGKKFLLNIFYQMFTFRLSETARKIASGLVLYGSGHKSRWVLVFMHRLWSGTRAHRRRYRLSQPTWTLTFRTKSLQTKGSIQLLCFIYKNKYNTKHLTFALIKFRSFVGGIFAQLLYSEGFITISFKNSVRSLKSRMSSCHSLTRHWPSTHNSCRTCRQRPMSRRAGAHAQSRPCTKLKK